MSIQAWIVSAVLAVLLGILISELKTIEAKLDRIAGFVSDLAGEKEPKR